MRILGILILLIFALTACAPDAVPPRVDLGCDAGYVPFSNGCCEDRDGDEICDPDGRMVDREGVVIETPKVQENIYDEEIPEVREREESSSSSGSSSVEASGDLSSFPSNFNRGGMLIIAGSNGGAFEIKVVNNFLSALVGNGLVGARDVDVKLDIDNVDRTKNHILFGTPCNNQFIVELVTDCSSLVSEGEGLLRVVEKDGVDILLVVGTDEASLKRAVDKLVEGVTGSEVRV